MINKNQLRLPDSFGVFERRGKDKDTLDVAQFRRHVVYLVELPETYVGMTIEHDGDPRKSARENVKHYWNVARKSDKDYPLPNTLRNLDSLEHVKIRILDRPMGKDAAKDSRRKWIEKLNPDLNSPGYIKKAS